MDALAVLQRLGRGRLIEDVVAALASTAQEVVETGKPGTVTVTLKVSTKSIGDSFVMIEEKVAKSAPKRDPLGAWLFSVDEGLHVEDPRQTKLEFRTVDRIDRETGEIREPAGEVTVREVAP